MSYQYLSHREKRGSFFSLVFIVLYVGIALPKHLLMVNPHWSITVDVLVHIVIPTSVVLFLYLSTNTAFSMKSELEWRVSNIAISILLGIVSVQIISGFILGLTNLFNPSTGQLPSYAKFSIVQFGLWGVFYLALTAGLLEEWLFKWVLIRCFRSVPSQFVFVFISSTLFGVAHYGQGVIPMVVFGTIWGIPTAVYYYQKRNISNLVVIHATHDLLVFLGIFLYADR